jgi:hypothetical protein
MTFSVNFPIFHLFNSFSPYIEQSVPPKAGSLYDHAEPPIPTSPKNGLPTHPEHNPTQSWVV